ncbi:MAG: MerR family transcriptional regulator [Saccharofermentanales bacterium]|jgi:DNA-binding transcriptional MerR regulator
METKSLNDMDSPRFKIGEVSEALSMPRQTIRYFEDMGLVVPIRNKESNHRRYSIYDVYKMTIRKQYKNIGVSIAETETIFKTTRAEDIFNILSKCEAILKKERDLAELRVISIEKFKERVRRTETHLNRYLYAKRPAFWKIPHMADKDLLTDSVTNMARQIAVELLPLSVYTFTIDTDEWLDHSISDCRDLEFAFCGHWDLSIESPFAERVGFDKMPTAQYVPEEENCIYTVFKQKETHFLQLDRLRDAMEFINNNRLKVAGDIYGNIVISRHNEEGEYERYFEAWIPVTDA